MAEKNFDITIGDWSGGLNQYDRPRQLAENESQSLENFKIVGRGGIELRRGYDTYSTGGSATDPVNGLLPFYKTGASPASYLCIFNNGHLYTITDQSATWTDQGSYGTDNGERVGGTNFNNLAIFGNGVAANDVKKFDGTTLANLGGTPPDAQYFEKNQHVVFAWGEIANPSIFYWCDTDDVEAWASGIASNQEVAVQDGSNLTAFAVHNNDIISFKDYSKYGVQPVLDGTTELPLGFVSRDIADGSDGTRSPFSLAKAWDGIYYLGTDNGFQKFGLQENFPDRRNPRSLSFKISPLINNINQDQLKKAAGMFYDNKYWCSVATGASTTNNMTYVYDTVYGGWSLYSISASCFAVFPDANGKRVPHFGSEAGGTVYRFNNRFIDAYDETNGTGQSIHGHWLSKRFRLPEKVSKAKIVIEGACTNPCYANFFINLRYTGEGDDATGDEDDVKTKGQKDTRTFPITEDQIYETTTGANYSGGIVSGESPSGAGTGVYTEMYDFKKEIYLPSDIIDQAEDIEFGIDINKTSHGIRLDYVRLEGTLST